MRATSRMTGTTTLLPELPGSLGVGDRDFQVSGNPSSRTLRGGEAAGDSFPCTTHRISEPSLVARRKCASEQNSVCQTETETRFPACGASLHKPEGRPKVCRQHILEFTFAFNPSCRFFCFSDHPQRCKCFQPAAVGQIQIFERE